ncbi:hypothetical protein FA15DRAFT_667825 [Coprinopsis marcescibilis]|uniref:Formyl transferase N-terminal domain-containing protein n=1 Tax=Coprinopsis marcescibilis TaxID=230819 RepID=A0A5C3L043_COPMA|nr:hypothetical protein FA15DRAFT_667825 [Coprinopsis marcescibilis]
MGRDEFSCLVLRELHAASDVWNELVVVTNPDQRVGRRGSGLSVSPLKLSSDKLPGTRVEYIPHTKPEFRKWKLPEPFSSYVFSPSEGNDSGTPSPPANHVLVTASFGRILTRKHLSHFLPHRRLNVHPSLLPQYRGPAPIQHSLLNGDHETGVCVIEMLDAVPKKDPLIPTDSIGGVQGPDTIQGDNVNGEPVRSHSRKSRIDAGDIWARNRLVQPASADFEQMRDLLAVEGGRLLVDVLRNFKHGIECRAVSQITLDDHITIRAAPMIGLEDGLVDPAEMTAEDICRKWRAIGHQRPIHTVMANSGKPVQLHQVAVLSDQLSDIDQSLSLVPGSVICKAIDMVTFTQQQANKHGNNRDSRTNFSTADEVTSNKQSKSRSARCLFVRCKGNEILVVPRIKPEGKPVLPAGDFWNGLKGGESIRFAVPSHPTV